MGIYILQFLGCAVRLITCVKQKNSYIVTSDFCGIQRAILYTQTPEHFLPHPLLWLDFSLLRYSLFVVLL